MPGGRVAPISRVAASRSPAARACMNASDIETSSRRSVRIGWTAERGGSGDCIPARIAPGTVDSARDRAGRGRARLALAPVARSGPSRLDRAARKASGASSWGRWPASGLDVLGDSERRLAVADGLPLDGAAVRERGHPFGEDRRGRRVDRGGGLTAGKGWSRENAGVDRLEQATASAQAGSRRSGQVMQWPPPRPRPSSEPSRLMTSMPALRSSAFVYSLRS